MGPRLEQVNQLNGMNETASLLFLSERESYTISGYGDKALKKFAARIASQLYVAYEGT